MLNVGDKIKIEWQDGTVDYGFITEIGTGFYTHGCYHIHFIGLPEPTKVWYGKSIVHKV